MASREYHCKVCENIYYDEDLSDPVGDDISCPGCFESEKISAREYDPTLYMAGSDDCKCCPGCSEGECSCENCASLKEAGVNTYHFENIQCLDCERDYTDEIESGEMDEDTDICPHCGGPVEIVERTEYEWDKWSKMKESKGFGETELTGQYIKTYKQRTMAGKIISDIANAEEPHALAEKLKYPVTTVKSFLRKLRDEDVLKTRTISVDGKDYVAVDPETNAYLLEKDKNWPAFAKEYRQKKS